MTYQPAPFLRRLGARIVDLIFALVLTFVLAIPFSVVGALLSPALDPILGRPALVALLGSLCYFLAYVGLEVFLLVRRDGQTLGKGLLGLKVVSAAAASAPRQLGLAAATLRMVLIFVPFVLISLAGGNPEDALLNGLAGTGLLSLLVSLALAGFGGANRRALHDLAAGTRVVTAAKRGISFKQDLTMMIPGRIDLTKRV